jgi:uncharacterized protein YbjT (DUF2867 family)
MGGRLVPHLLIRGHQVRVMVRDIVRLQGRPWLDQVEVVQGDVFEPDTLLAALEGIDSAYYLIHSMRDHADFGQRDLVAAINFGNAARASNVRRIIYLGGLGNPDAGLSVHLRSRQQTGDTLRDSGISVTEFRAGIIVGSGSISFEIIRYLTERLPVMICPRWVFTRTQPIAIRDALNYLVAALETPESEGKIIEIGGADILNYKDMMLIYARLRGLRRFIIPVPVLTPRLSSYWVHLVTPIPSAIAQPLIKGLYNEVVVHDNSAQLLFPHIRTMNYETAVAHALSSLAASDLETSWSDALVSSQGDTSPVVFTMQDGILIEQRQLTVNAPSSVIYREFAALGGQRGWLAFNSLWHLRGGADRLVGGVGFRRGRRHPEDVRIGDTVDFWRVEAIEPDHLLRLRAEMKVPGRAWLQFKAERLTDHQSQLIQTAFFAPKGLLGLLYWYLLYPVHGFIFSRLIRRLAERAEMRAIQAASTGPAAPYSQGNDYV